MKKRLQFVANSSASSFVCSDCGAEYCGMDMSIYDADMWQCVNGHTVCDEHLIDVDFDEIIASWAEENGIPEAEIEDYDDGSYRYELPAKYCPLCNFKRVTDHDLLDYALMRLGYTREELSEVLKIEFGTLDKLKKIIKEKEETPG
jgi:hypothetical protein